MTADPLPQVIAQEVNLAALDWNAIDTARGWGTGSPKTTRLNGGGAEYSADSGATKTTTGFALAGLSGGNHLYMAIRKNT